MDQDQEGGGSEEERGEGDDRTTSLPVGAGERGAKRQHRREQSSSPLRRGVAGEREQPARAAVQREGGAGVCWAGPSRPGVARCSRSVTGRLEDFLYLKALLFLRLGCLLGSSHHHSLNRHLGHWELLPMARCLQCYSTLPPFTLKSLSSFLPLYSSYLGY